MELTLVRTKASELETDVVVLLDWEDGDRANASGPLAAFYNSGEITGKFLEFTLIHGLEGYKARRVLIAGAGKRAKFDTSVLRKIAGAAIRFLKGKSAVGVTFVLDEGNCGAAPVEAVAEAAILGAWEPDYLKAEKEGKAIASVAIAVSSASTPDAAPAHNPPLANGRILGRAAGVAHDLLAADRARRMARTHGLSFEVLDRDRMTQLGMGALLGVAQGSAEPPALIVMQYEPENAASGDRLGLVGKGVTFDTGGISIKPSEGMEKMKYDMAGGAAVIAAMQAIALLKPPVAVTGIVPAVENMPGSRAQRPGDIVTSLSGKTIEVLNTDAEGRLILADAITYAKQLGCTHLVDAATLTGAIVVALGHASSGVFSNDDQLLARWMAAAKEGGEKMWHMPLDEEYRDQLKTVYADIQNIGGRWGGACSAAMFLKEFAGDTPWVHVDVAGTAWLDDAKPFLAKGPTGIPVGSFVNLALNWK